MLLNTVAYPVAYLGAAKAGVVTAGINTRFRQREVSHILESSGAAAVITTEEFLPLVEAAPRVLSPDELLDATGDSPRLEAEPEDPVAIVYTSGTTGSPKGATYTHRCLDAIERIEQTFEPELHPRSVAAIPFPHMGFMARVAANIAKRAYMVVLEGWSARAHLEAIDRERLTVAGGIPTQLQLMLMDPDLGRFDLSSLRSCAMGGAPASPEAVRRIREGFRVPVTVRYSCTELGLATGTRAGDPDDVVAETVGRPLPEVDLRILEPNEEAIGEIAVRSPAMFAGYWREAERTREALDSEGFFRTGDLGRLRRDGNVQLAGRLKEMYIRGGYNVYPVEVEALLREHPKVALAAVIGVPDDVLGERGKAFVVPRDGADPPKLDELRAFVGTRIADFKAPDLLELRDELPMTAMYKVDKRALLEEFSRDR